MEDGDLLLEVLKLVERTGDARALASCRLVSKAWRRLTDSVLSNVRNDFFSCRPDSGSERGSITIRTNTPCRTSVTFERPRDRRSGGDADARRARAAACDLLEYKGIRESCSGIRTKLPVRLECERGLSLAETFALRSMSRTLREIDLAGMSAATLPARVRNALCTCVGTMPALAAFSAPRHDLSPANVACISRSRSLRRLNIFQNAAGEAGCAALARVTTLRALDIGNNDIGGGAASLAKLTGLRTLNVNFNAVSDDNLAEMVSGLKSLETLKSTWNEAGPLAGRAIKAARSLTSLDLSFTDRGLCDLLPPSLASLEFGHSGVGDLELRSIAGCCPRLARLRLSNSAISADGIGCLVGLPLTDLDLSWNGLGYRAAVCISEALPALRRLDVRRNDVLDVGAIALFGLPNLRWLNVSQNNLSRTVVQNLRHRARTRGGGGFVLLAHG